ncbi:hypothetical protein QR680_013669 [Steinernema hermaphroditum]|uniref:Uncharacterized protein n=1 Tax=Steinernema hermaphroditum TaxID=289476 RepID=A0AA39M2W4_9BILA|nr:hypothetical protein QR680_013669 [Steinernema hermaphroditum]
MCDQKFAGKVVIVTGSSSGIGQGIALLFGQQGANVTIHGLDGDEVKETQKVMLDEGITAERILMVSGDLLDPIICEKLIEETISKWGKIDILVNNAGVDSKPGVALDSEENFDFTFGVNVKQIVRINKLAVPYLEKTKGAIVNTCSVTALARMHNVPTFYAMSKAALDHYVRYEAPGLAEKGIRMNNIAPGITLTNIRIRIGFSQEESDKLAKKFCDTSVPLGRPGLPKDMAQAVAFLASDEASYVCGTTLLVDGGMLLGRA